MTDKTSTRLDAFVDAAFAFAVTLMVVGASGTGVDGDLLVNAAAAIPSFAIGFAIIALFWWAHVAWRNLRGDGGWQSLLLSLLLIFVVLVYEVPLRAMATSFAAYLSGAPGGFKGSLATLFVFYGLGFSAMSAIIALLFRDALRNPALDLGGRRSALGQGWIWTILAGTGVVSVLMSLRFPLVAPFVYATLPLSIGLFAWRWDWGAVSPRE
ncbi:MAG: TMEM175 family protein [Pseudomonadota bacterium]